MIRSPEGSRAVVPTGLLALFLLIVLASIAASPAHAADTCVGHPSDPSVVCVRENDRIVDVCDRHPDGHRAYARVVDRRSYPQFQSPFYDDNDSAPGCSNIPFASGVVSIAVCVQSEGCSAFKQVAAPPAPVPPVPPGPPSAVPPTTPAPPPMASGTAPRASRITLGIADSEPDTFVNPDGGVNEPWRRLNVREARVIVPYDIATRPRDEERRKEFEAVLGAAVKAGATVNVGLQRIEKDPPASDKFPPGVRPARLGQAPDRATYRVAFREFLLAYGWLVAYIGVWNEPNIERPTAATRPELPGSTAGRRLFLDEPRRGCGAAKPSARTCGPRLAALYYRWAGDVCRDLAGTPAARPCANLIAGEFAGTPKWRYLQQYKRHLGALRPSIWGVHNYADMIRFQNRGINDARELTTFLNEIYCKRPHHCNAQTDWKHGETWIGATGAFYSTPCHRDGKPRKGLRCGPNEIDRVFGERSQCRAVRFIRRTAERYERIRRIYYYTYADSDYGKPGAGDGDTGLVAGRSGSGPPRQAYFAIQRPVAACT